MSNFDTKTWLKNNHTSSDIKNKTLRAKSIISSLWKMVVYK